jgi:SAM-dependent MidA family methyltransferase
MSARPGRTVAREIGVQGRNHGGERERTLARGADGAVASALGARIAAAIDAAGGWIPFDRFMDLALYEPGLGYYARPHPIFGAAGDFVTAPELTPLFGAVVGRQVAAWLEAGWPATAPGAPAVSSAGTGSRSAGRGGQAPTVFEFGAGAGALAASILGALDRFGFGSVDYRIVEVSADLRERQRETIAARARTQLDRVAWLDRLPERIDGVVIANEVLDAMPVRVFELDGGQPGAAAVIELGVGLDADRRAFEWRPRRADARLHRIVADLEREAGPWPRPYRSELGEQAAAWVRTVAERIERGAILVFDYGFGAREFYHPQRDSGTLMAHRRHRADPDVLADPGSCDISAHVDFSAIGRAAEQGGLEVLGYCSQARFLLNGGLLDDFAAVAREPVAEWAAAAHAVQRLLSEAEMGELFKAAAFGRGLGADAALPGFAAGDRSAAL